jgi:hypothetical protein
MRQYWMPTPLRPRQLITAHVGAHTGYDRVADTC